MLSMVRFRRYQVFLVLAAVITILLFRFSHTSNWDRYGQPERLDFPSSPKDGGGHSSSKASPPEAVGGSPEDDKSPPGTHTEALAPLKAEDVNANHAAAQTVPVVVLPDRQIPTPPEMLQDAGVATDIHPVNPPGRQEFPTFSAVPTTIHWVKQPEHFPVPTESIIKLPTGAPAAIPQIQYAFKKETHDESIIRERRQSAVKKEFMKAWTGYKSQAWLHDELAPQSGKFRDPFCGWAATLVDSLDTLWIMGLEDEFEEAVNAVNQIDFTTSPRKDIPMFETTIRYLGGLLGAYDVSGAKYKSLLDKAEELADILIGAFDTPNRMPVLYYEWKPAFASQPHRAGQRSNLAELGSMTLEFTRLAQLTKEPRYYDAVARVTNALEEFQDRTRLTGIFPSNVDATGCNRTAALGPKPSPEEQPKGYESVVPKERKRPISQGDNSRTDPGSLELQILPGEITKARIDGWDENREPESSKSHLKELEGAATSKMEPRGSTEQADGKRILNISPRQVNPISGLPVDLPKSKLEIGLSLDGWDCPEQGLETSAPGGSDSFSMGGGQDSTYEYFPKQYLLLGGRDDTYRKMYLKTIEAVRKSLLFRPMIPGNHDILFSGSIVTDGKPGTSPRFDTEISHLTCFIGGMVGMGAQIFDIKGDLEIAKKLTDGCVWAYGSMPAEVMAEAAHVLPCESAENCIWNETVYYDYIDPRGEERDQKLENYLADKAARKAEKEAAEKAAEKEAAEKAAETKFDSEGIETKAADDEPRDILHSTSTLIEKRQVDEKDGLSQPIVRGSENGPAGPQSDVPLPANQAKAVVEPRDLHQPLSHMEYVEEQIKQNRLPPGYVKVGFKKYILRPEAIESVWYMYRITGDPSWQAKGWRMFEAVISATSAKYGHSAISDVTSPTAFLTDEMESFWLAETLKYFYLLFSTPDTISLDEWVLNTEAHPFKRDDESVW